MLPQSRGARQAGRDAATAQARAGTVDVRAGGPAPLIGSVNASPPTGQAAGVSVTNNVIGRPSPDAARSSPRILAGVTATTTIPGANTMTEREKHEAIRLQARKAHEKAQADERARPVEVAATNGTFPIDMPEKLHNCCTGKEQWNEFVGPVNENEGAFKGIITWTLVKFLVMVPILTFAIIWVMPIHFVAGIVMSVVLLGTMIFDCRRTWVKNLASATYMKKHLKKWEKTFNYVKQIGYTPELKEATEHGRRFKPATLHFYIEECAAIV